MPPAWDLPTNSIAMTVFAMKPFGGGRLGNARLCLGFLKRYPGVLPRVGIEKLSAMQMTSK
jgi:hypothetical protein